jgi:hypothetical protein
MAVSLRPKPLFPHLIGIRELTLAKVTTEVAVSGITPTEASHFFHDMMHSH